MKRIQKVRCIICAAFFLCLIAGGTIAVLRTPDAVSLSERRTLRSRPTMNRQTLESGEFFTDTEKYLLDQFPERDLFRRVKAVVSYDIFGKIANNNIVIDRGQAAEISYPLKDKFIDIYLRRLNTVKDEYLASPDLKVYHTLIPDIIYYMGDGTGIPKIDYENLWARLADEGPGTYVDITDTLCLSDYYTSDPHIKIASLTGTADLLLTQMQAGSVGEVREGEVLRPFYGVYYGHSALPLPPDGILPVYTDAIDRAIVTRYEGKVQSEGKIYDFEKFAAADAYDFFLGGACTVLTIDNPTAPDGKTLYLFSDSFGRSLAPLLLSGYSRIVFYDIRYVSAAQALRIMPAESGDVLFAYSLATLAVSPSLLLE